MTIELTHEIAAKVLSTVDAGLCSGLGDPVPGQMCVEAAVCYALGLPHGDDPGCVSRALRSFKIEFNDERWSNNEARAKGLRRLALVQLGSEGYLDDKKFARRLAKLAVQKAVRAASAAAASAAAAAAAAYAAYADARDKFLADFAEAVVQLLIEMEVPGVKWLTLVTA